jgi:putative hydrolase of the HAD superfamily
VAIRGLSRRAALLDALGTLVELEPPAPRLRNELAGRFGLSVTPVQAEQAIAAEIAYYRRHLDEGRDRAALADLRRRCAAALADQLEASLGRELPPLDAMTEALLASLSFRPFDDVVPALRSLKDLGVRVVVVSNWDVSLPEVLERLGLMSYLDGVVTSAAAGSRKPERPIFELALGLAGAQAHEALHVGDSLAEDVAGARAVGIEAVLIRRSGRGPSIGAGVEAITSLGELPARLARGAVGETDQ